MVLEEHAKNVSLAKLHSLGLPLHSVCVVDLELSPEALEGHLLKYTLHLEYPEYAVRQRALRADRALLENQIHQYQVATCTCTCTYMYMQ